MNMLSENIVETTSQSGIETISHSMSDENKRSFAHLIEAQLKGVSLLPYGLGLDIPVYRQLLSALENPALSSYNTARVASNSPGFSQRSELIKSLIEQRMRERNELVTLLFNHAHSTRLYSAQAAIITATACLSPNHLWKAMGFSNREQLKGFLSHNFPTLVAKNTNNMRWKRFFYLQLCQSGGDFVCRSPSCETCTSYNDCFVTHE